MRVNYTLPGLLPAEPQPSEVARTGDSPFRARLGIPPAPRWLNWRSLLRLDDIPENATTMGPPPRPPGIELGDAATQRMVWRQMLDGRVAAFDDAGEPSRGEAQAIGQMLTLLVRYQEAEDAIASRRLAEPEG